MFKVSLLDNNIGNLGKISIESGVEHGFMNSLNSILKKSNVSYLQVKIWVTGNTFTSDVFIPWFRKMDYWKFNQKNLKNNQIFLYVYEKLNWFVTQKSEKYENYAISEFFNRLDEFYCIPNINMDDAIKKLARFKLKIPESSFPFVNFKKLISDESIHFEQYENNVFYTFEYEV
jgi:hypothetical protein